MVHVSCCSSNTSYQYIVLCHTCTVLSTQPHPPPPTSHIPSSCTLPPLTEILQSTPPFPKAAPHNPPPIMIKNTQGTPHTERLWTVWDHCIPRLGYWPYCTGVIHASLVVLHLSKAYGCAPSVQQSSPYGIHPGKHKLRSGPGTIGQGVFLWNPLPWRAQGFLGKKWKTLYSWLVVKRT